MIVPYDDGKKRPKLHLQIYERHGSITTYLETTVWDAALTNLASHDDRMMIHNDCHERGDRNEMIT